MRCRLPTLVVVALLCAGGAVAAQSGADLIAAARAGDRAAVERLLARGADPNGRQPDGTSALAWAVQRDDAAMAAALIAARADVNAANDYGVTPLSLACTNRNPTAVAALLKAGADPEAASWSGETPLMICTRTGTVEGVRALLAAEANVNARTRRGQTALMWAAANRRPEITRMLVERGAALDAVSGRLPGFTPPRYLTFGLTESSYDQHPGEVHEDPHSSRGGFTALMFAARAGDLDSARVLLDAGASVGHRSPHYGNALLVATLNGQDVVAKLLLERGADPNVTDEWGIAPLHYALRDGITAIAMPRAHIPSDRAWIRPSLPGLVEALLARGADPNARIGKGLPPYSYLPFARDDIAQMPYVRQPGATPFLLAAAAGDVASMRALLARGANPLLATDEGVTAVMVAAGLGKLQALTPEQEGRSLEAVRLAVERGVDVNAAMHDGRTALMAAAHVGANSIIEFLAQKGADLNAQDKFGHTPLGLAMNIRAPGAPSPRGVRRTFRFASSGQGVSAQGPGAQRATAELLLRLGAKPLPAQASSR